MPTKSWEYYQQTENGNFFTLYWVCGLAGASSNILGATFEALALANNDLYAVPFDVIKPVTVSALFFNRTTPAVGGRVRIGIYGNRSDSDNAPSQRIREIGGEFPLDAAGGIQEVPFAQPVNLAGDQRYWVVLNANGSAAGAVIAGIGGTNTPVIFWGAKIFNTGRILRPATGLKLTRAYGPLPAMLTDVAGLPASVYEGVVPCICLTISSVAVPRAAIMEQGRILVYVPSDTFTPAAVMTGTLSASAVYVDGTFYGATAYQDLATAGNTSSATFTYAGSEAAGGVAVGVRWNNGAEEGVFAFIDSSGPTLKIYEMSTGWVYVQDSSTSLALTTGNSYTLTLADDGSVVTATITDDTGVQTCSLTTSLITTNTEVMFGWLGTTASHAFDAVITGVTSLQTGTVATPDFFPAAGTYLYAQSVYLICSTPGASIYYTTDGSTPTSSSTLSQCRQHKRSRPLPSWLAGPTPRLAAPPTRSRRGRSRPAPSTAPRQAPFCWTAAKPVSAAAARFT